MLPIIKAYEVICLLHNRLKSENPFIFYPFQCFQLCLGMKMPITWQPFISRSFSELHHVSHVIMHQVQYIFLCTCYNGGLQSTESQRFSGKISIATFFIGLYYTTSIQQVKSFYTYVLVGYFTLILQSCIKRVYRLSSIQRFPQTMHAWGRIHFIILKRIWGFKS